ncbi:MAG: murein biosynthesis integral membrane protein MurJ [Mariprofundales bacterium]
MQGKHSKSTLLRHASSVGLWTLLSRILGFIRDILLARILGASLLADAFLIGFKLPNFFRRMFAEGTLTVALVPVLQEQRQQSEQQAHDFLNAIAGLLITLLLAITIAGIIAMPVLLIGFAPGFYDEPNRWHMSLELSRWMFPYLLLVCLAAMGWGVLNAYKRFALAAASPAMLNIALIIAALWWAPHMNNPALGMAFGVLLGGFLQLAVLLPGLKRLGWLPKPNFGWRKNWNTAPIRETMRLFFPALLGVATVQINMLAGTILATLLPVGAVSYLYYADRLVQLPLGLFGIAMSTALLPLLAEAWAKDDVTSALVILRQGLTWLSWIILPACVGLWLLAEPIMQTLFAHGAFTAADAIATADTLRAYAIGLLAFCWVKVLASACYASKDAKTPLRYSAIAVGINIVLAIILMQWWGYVGLALATALASCIQACMLYAHHHRLHGQVLHIAEWKHIATALLACMPMAIFIHYFSQYWSFPTGQLVQVLWLSANISIAALIFFAIAKLAGVKLVI